MSLHINRFIDKLRGAEARGQKDFSMPINDAKDLHADITRLLTKLHVLHEEVLAQQKEPVQSTIAVSGGSF